jgi:hypothetical protein
MKYQTKLKIIRFVEKVIGYKHPPIQPLIVEQRTIQIARGEKVFHKNEFAYITIDTANHMVAQSLMNMLMKTPAVVYTQEDVKLNEYEDPKGVKITATLKYIFP